MAKEDTSKAQYKSISTSHKINSNTSNTSILQQGLSTLRSIGLAIKQTVKRATGVKHVQFKGETQVHIIPSQHEANDAMILVIYDSGADGHYITEEDRKQAKLSILRKSSKKVNVANGETCKEKFTTQLPFESLSMSARTADTFTEFPHSLMSVGKIADDGTISIFTKSGVTVHKEQDVLIRMKGKPILIGVRDDQGRYRISLIQQRG